MDDIFVYHVALPDGINEAVMPCADGYTVYINEKLDEMQRVNAYNHAMKHIKNDDWNNTDIQTIENEAHRRETL